MLIILENPANWFFPKFDEEPLPMSFTPWD